MKINFKSWLTNVFANIASRSNKPLQADVSPANDPPLKAEIFSALQMELYGQKLARSHRLSPKTQPYYLLKRLGNNEAVITHNCFLLNDAEKASMAPAGEWLLDNYYLIEEQIRMVRHHLPKNFGKGLPVLSAPHSCPRIYDIAAEAIAHGDGRW